MYNTPYAITKTKLNSMLTKYKSMTPEIRAQGGEYTAANLKSRVQRIGNILVIPIFKALSTNYDFYCWMEDGISYDVIRDILENAASDKEIEKVLLNFNTPGGAVNGCPELAEYINYYDKNIKPVYSYVGSEALSAGYYLACSTRRVFGHRSSFVGSIGVLSIFEEKEGKEEIIISNSQSPLKSIDIHKDDGRAQIQKHIDFLAEIFAADVAKYRNTDIQNVFNNFGRGDAVQSNEAVSTGMIDEVMNFDECITWIQAQSVQNGILNTPMSAGNQATGKTGKKNFKRGNKMAKRNLLAEFVLVNADDAGELPVQEVTIDVIRQQFPDIAQQLMDEGAAASEQQANEVEDVAQTADTENPAEMDLVAQARKREITVAQLQTGLLKAKQEFKKNGFKALGDLSEKRREDKVFIPNNPGADHGERKSALSSILSKKRRITGGN